MGWDRATPFIIDLQVGAEDIDGLGHANNAVYVTWLERCAWRHSQRLGLDLVEYRRLDRAMAVVRHEIDYLAAAYEDDELQLATWIVDWDQRLKMTRHFQLIRPSDNTTLAARADHVCLHRTVHRQAQAHAGGVHRGLWPGVADLEPDNLMWERACSRSAASSRKTCRCIYRAMLTTTAYREQAPSHRGMRVLQIFRANPVNCRTFFLECVFHANCFGAHGGVGRRHPAGCADPCGWY